MRVQDVISIELKVIDARRKLCRAGGGAIGAGCNLHSVRLVLRKVNLVTDYRLGTFKVKTRSDLTLSLFSIFVLRKGKEMKNSFLKEKFTPLFFLFTETSRKYYQWYRQPEFTHCCIK